MKCRAVIKQNFVDDIELDEEGVAEMLMDENAVASMPRFLSFMIVLRRIQFYFSPRLFLLLQAGNLSQCPVFAGRHRVGRRRRVFRPRGAPRQPVGQTAHGILAAWKFEAYWNQWGRA